MQSFPTRRQAIAAGAATAFAIVPRHVLGGPGYTPPSEQLTKGIVGVGGMGSGHFGYEGTRTVAVCDVDRRRLEKAKAKGKCKGFSDFRELLELPEVDIVHVPTPPHWHALISIAAARAGKDIWCEKPLSRTIGEGQAVVKAVQEHGRMFRINTWFRFNGGLYGSGTTGRELRKLVASGLLGSPLKATVGACTGFSWKFNWSGKTNLTPQPIPDGFDYDMWLGPAPYKPYHPHRTHGSFRGYWDYDGGGLGDMGMHYLDAVQYALDKDHTSPVFIEGKAPAPHPDAVGRWHSVYMRYADGTELVLDAHNPGNAKVPFLEGPNGKVFKGFNSTIPDLRKKLAAFPDPAPQVTSFSESVRTRKKFALNEENGHRSCTLVNLGKIAIQLRRPLHFDPVKQRFINDEEANRLINQPMRGHWSLDGGLS
jgi:predicted dehydrogenase